MVSKVDINNDGIIDICEFIRMMSLQQNPLITPESQLEDIFHIFDKDGSGFITRVCVKRAQTCPSFLSTDS